MKKVLLFLAIILGLVAMPMSAQTPKMKVAVYMTGNDVEDSYKKVIGAKLVSAITATDDYAAVERTADFLAALSTEQDYQMSGEVRDSQIARLGQKFGVKYVVVADISELFDELFVASRLINVESGLVEKAFEVNSPAESMQQLVNLAQDLAGGLLGTSGSVSSGGSRSSKINGYEYVDLGLSVKWATCNVGANSPEQFGHYYAWGETATKGRYDEDNSRTYGVSGIGSISGRPEYDVARAYWGGTWRIPTRFEMQELVDRCNWQSTTQGGQNGYKITGPNGNSIFIPAAGFKRDAEDHNVGERVRCWTSTSDENNTAYGLSPQSSTVKVENGKSRVCGFSIRPVSD